MYSTQTLPGRRFLLSLCLALATLPFLSAQTLQLDASVARHQASLVPGANTLEICHLEKGKSYLLTINGLLENSFGSWNFSGSGALVTQSGPQGVYFKAERACVRLHSNLQLQAATDVWISLAKAEFEEKTNVATAADASNVAPLVVNANPGAATALVAALFGGSNTGCYQISNVVRTGNNTAFGSFSGGTTNIGLADGLVIASANAGVLDGPNTQTDANGGFGINSTDDPDLAALSTANQYDLAILEFDIVAATPTIDFQFVFGSEEYCEYANSIFNDVFGLFISGPGISGVQNLARVPNTNQPVSVNTINQTVNSNFFVNNTLICNGLPMAAPAETQLDGWTTVLTASAIVTPGATYHFKIAIADISDATFTSAVFMRGQAGPTTTVNATVLPTNINEGCQPAEVRFARTNNDVTQPLSVDFTVSGTATPGTDYTPLSSPVIIPAGASDVVIPLNALADGLSEGPETVIFSVPTACAPDFSLTINDVDTLTATLADASGCSTSGITLTPTVTGGVSPYTYVWSDASTGAALTITTPGSSTVSVTVTDVCGVTQSASATVELAPSVALDLTASVCPGNTVILLGESFDTPGQYIRTQPGANGQCDTTYTITISAQSPVVVSDTLALCPGDSLLYGGAWYTAPAVATDTLAGSGGDCDTVFVLVLTLRPTVTLSDTLALCPGDSVLIGGVLYGAPGLAISTLPGLDDQCDTTVTTILTLRTLNTASDTLALCPGDSLMIGGVLYGAPGTATSTLAGANGQCDTVLTTVLILRPTPTTTIEISLCPGDSVVIDGVLYGAPGEAISILPGTNGQCDTTLTTILVPRSLNAASDTLALCPGDSVLIGGVLYGAPGEASSILNGTNGQCDTVLTTILTLRPAVEVSDTLTLCPGDSVLIGGVLYGAPDEAIDTLSGIAGQCDTVRTTVLLRQDVLPSTVKLVCPAIISQTIDPGADLPVVLYDDPTGTTDECPCPELTIIQTSGLPSGSVFPLGTTTNCFQATDACGNVGTCCTTVTIEEDGPCDVKTNGCIKWEILDITKLADNTKRYRMRVTNYCTPPLINAIFQLPNGVTAVSPANNSTYVAPSGRTYTVKNPNYSTYYSIRFNSSQPGISGGQSDIFEYRLPPMPGTVLFILAQVRLSPAIYIQGTQNTFYCETDAANREAPEQAIAEDAQVYPNPATDFVLIEVPEPEALPVRVFDARGVVVLHTQLPAGEGPRAVELPASMADGIYLLELRRADGRTEVLRFVVAR